MDETSHCGRPCALLLIHPPVRGQDTPVKGKIVAVDLFKNGLAVVKCEVTLRQAGDVRPR